MAVPAADLVLPIPIAANAGAAMPVSIVVGGLEPQDD
jgi:hypothetical protein